MWCPWSTTTTWLASVTKLFLSSRQNLYKPLSIYYLKILKSSIHGPILSYCLFHIVSTLLSGFKKTELGDSDLKAHDDPWSDGVVVIYSGSLDHGLVGAFQRWHGGSCCSLAESIRWWTYASLLKVTTETPDVLLLEASDHGLIGAFWGWRWRLQLFPCWELRITDLWELFEGNDEGSCCSLAPVISYAPVLCKGSVPYL